LVSIYYLFFNYQNAISAGLLKEMLAGVGF